jgi:hypothetical protein
MDDLDQTQTRALLAAEARRLQLAELFSEGPDAVRERAMHEIALVLAKMQFLTRPHTDAEVEAYARDQTAFDPVFRSALHTLAGILDDFVDAALASARAR